MYGKLKQGGEYDVIVCGCGSAGFTAAVQAARAGAKTAVVERYGMPGGIMTVGGNNDVAQFHAYHKQVIAGIGWEFIERLSALGYAPIPDMTVDAPHWKYGIRVNIPAAAYMMDTMLTEAGVTLYYGQNAVEVTVSGEGESRRVDGIIISTKDGLVRLGAKTVIDCTGDGDICCWAGAEYELGETLQPGTIRFYPDKRLPDDETVAAIDSELKAAHSDGRLDNEYRFPSSLRDIIASEGCNRNHINGFNAADSDSMTAAEIDGRRAIFALMETLGENARIDNVAPTVAPRETRRIFCDHYITCDEYVDAVEHEDDICYSFYPIDLHRAGRQSIKQVFLTHGRVPRIPYSALTVKGFKNLLAAGRCASGDRLANSAYRVKASCMAMGQAAGAAAALAVREHGGNIRAVDIADIRRLTADNGAIVPGLNDAHLYE